MAPHELMDRYAVFIVFFNVFASSLGLPLPATPTLMMAGASIALAADGFFSSSVHVVAIVGSAVAGGALADCVWFHSSRRFGATILHGACRRLMPRTVELFHTARFSDDRGVRVLLIARFVPGLALLSIMLCGARVVRLRSFVLHDCAGIGLWALAALTLGALCASALIGAR
jgi:membrane protein DedA with SNARE-associated domain